MRVSEVASRYARATYELATSNKNQEKVFNDLRAVGEIFSKDTDIHAFIVSPLIKASEHDAVIRKAFENKGLSVEVLNLLLLLAEKGRLPLFQQIVLGYQEESDSANGVCRGTVRSAVSLSPEERQKIETIVERVLNKKVITTYKVDASVIGGLVAEVGSYRFDDTLESHLRRLKEDLNRRAH